MRVRAPEAFTLIIVWPIIAQPPMPPNAPERMFAAPWPNASRVLREWVSVMSSTSFAVMSDSRRPTTAIAAANGAMIAERLPRERHVRDEQLGQALRQLALVADGGHVDREDDRSGGQQHDRDERRGHDAW